jgi:hypothetical protein
VLAIIEDQEEMSTADVIPERFADGSVWSLSNVEHRCHGLSHQARIADGRQIDDPYAVGKTIEHIRRQFQRQARLATPAGARKCQQASGRHESQELRDFLIAPDEVRERHGKIVTAVVPGQVSMRRPGNHSHRWR